LGGWLCHQPSLVWGWAWSLDPIPSYPEAAACPLDILLLLGSLPFLAVTAIHWVLEAFLVLPYRAAEAFPFQVVEVHPFLAVAFPYQVVAFPFHQAEEAFPISC